MTEPDMYRNLQVAMDQAEANSSHYRELVTWLYVNFGENVLADHIGPKKLSDSLQTILEKLGRGIEEAQQAVTKLNEDFLVLPNYHGYLLALSQARNETWGGQLSKKQYHLMLARVASLTEDAPASRGS